jgi:hypothetical protein
VIEVGVIVMMARPNARGKAALLKDAEGTIDEAAQLSCI